MSSTNNNAASAETNNDRNVRQRANPLGLESLPDDTLLRVATYLSHTTRALLSVALTAPSTSYDLGGHNENEKDLMAKKVAAAIRECGWQSAASDSLSDVLSSAIAAGQLKKINNNPQHQKLSKASRIVLSNPYYRECFEYGTRIPYRRNDKYEEGWKTLDLLDLDKSLRMRLTDGDIAGILVCIDAVNNLEYIRLPHCINVRGSGLAPLRGSIILKKVDLSIVSEEVDSTTPKLSIDAVLPIFDSIMALNQNSLSRLHVPKVWHDSHRERLYNFYVDNYSLKNLDGYEQMSEQEKCQHRTNFLSHSNDWNEHNKYKIDCAECDVFRFASSHKGVRLTFEGGQRLKTCPNPKCGMKFCCENDDEYDHAMTKINKCDVCKESSCNVCDPDLFECNSCGRTLCSCCTDRFSCNLCCELENCLDCAIDGSGYTRECGGCNEVLCKYCDPGLTHMGIGERACECCRGVDQALWHGPDNPAEID